MVDRDSTHIKEIAMNKQSVNAVYTVAYAAAIFSFVFTLMPIIMPSSNMIC